MKYQYRIVLLLIVIIPSLLVLVMGSEAQDISSCDANPVLYQVFGIYCLNPVQHNIPEMIHPIGSILLFQDGHVTDMGIVSGYSWQPKEQRYAYWLITRPANWNSSPPFAGEYKVALPENIYGVQQ